MLRTIVCDDFENCLNVILGLAKSCKMLHLIFRENLMATVYSLVASGVLPKVKSLVQISDLDGPRSDQFAIQV